AFRKLVKFVEERDALDISRPQAGPARAFVHETLGDPLLAEMILTPLFFYGSAIENDIDLDQFAILFRALYIEGFARPFEGVRRIVRVLLDRYRELGGERLMKCGVRRLRVNCCRVSEIELSDGRIVTANSVISSIGADETLALLGLPTPNAALPRLAYAEHIACMKTLPAHLGWRDTIVFFNDSSTIDYRIPDSLVDTRSGVVCLPANYDFGGREMAEGMLRVTGLANYAGWKALPAEDYEVSKAKVSRQMRESALRHLPNGLAALPEDAITFSDTFTPLTVEKFTGHLRGGVYGSPAKIRDGRTPADNLFICGTDQGFLGIVGAILGGISIANLHVIGPGA
ncbi:MAG TPA: phytoene dehydrogenase, partial [Opitutales bacterium]|nr:phytoene dehydrogenase [Opitutales bacterium]